MSVVSIIKSRLLQQPKLEKLHGEVGSCCRKHLTLWNQLPGADWRSLEVPTIGWKGSSGMVSQRNEECCWTMERESV